MFWIELKMNLDAFNIKNNTYDNKNNTNRKHFCSHLERTAIKQKLKIFKTIYNIFKFCKKHCKLDFGTVLLVLDQKYRFWIQGVPELYGPLQVETNIFYMSVV